MGPLIFDPLILSQFPRRDAGHRLMTTADMKWQGMGLRNFALNVTAMLHLTGAVPGSSLGQESDIFRGPTRF
jgi:hypothetical protein